MKLLDDYFDMQSKLYKYFGYEEDWHVYPLDDRTEYFWFISEDNSAVYYAEKVEDFVWEEGKYFEDDIIANKIYPGKDYTAMLVDTHADGNMFLAIFKDEFKVARPDGFGDEE